MMTEPNLVGGLIGGSLIGLAAVLLLAMNGRIAGVSGILGGLLVPTWKGDRAWRAAFLFGLIAGAALYGAVKTLQGKIFDFRTSHFCNGGCHLPF